jgi:hypothetical protein
MKYEEIKEKITLMKFRPHEKVSMLRRWNSVPGRNCTTTSPQGSRNIIAKNAMQCIANFLMFNESMKISSNLVRGYLLLFVVQVQSNHVVKYLTWHELIFTCFIQEFIFLPLLWWSVRNVPFLLHVKFEFQNRIHLIIILKNKLCYASKMVLWEYMWWNFMNILNETENHRKICARTCRIILVSLIAFSSNRVASSNVTKTFSRFKNETRMLCLFGMENLWSYIHFGNLVRKNTTCHISEQNCRCFWNLKKERKKIEYTMYKKTSFLSSNLFVLLPLTEVDLWWIAGDSRPWLPLVTLICTNYFRMLRVLGFSCCFEYQGFSCFELVSVFVNDKVNTWWPISWVVSVLKR